MSPAATLGSADALGVPEPGPLDEFTRARITAMLRGYFGDVATLDAHVALLDTRGAWYAERVMGAWSTSQPDAFFGVVAHVVHTQLPGPSPQPDLERWIADGRPADLTNQPKAARTRVSARRSKVMAGRTTFWLWPRRPRTPAS